MGAALLAGITVGLAVAAYWPFYAHYRAQVGEGTGSLIGRFLGWVHASSPLGEWLMIWSFFLFLALVYVTVSWRSGSRGAEERRGTGAEERRSEGAEEQGREEQRSGGAEEQGGGGAAAETSREAEEGEDPGIENPIDAAMESVSPIPPVVAQSPTLPDNRRRFIALLVLLGVLALLAGMGRPTAAIAALPLCLALPLVFRRQASAGEAFLALLLVVGLGIAAGIELVYLRDFLQGGDWYRMNTLFKFSVPAWLLLGLAGGVMLPTVWAALTGASSPIRWLVRAALVIMLTGGLVFLFFGLRARVQDRFPGPRPAVGSLDGTAYMTVGRYTWPTGNHLIQLANEREAIRWMLDNVTGSPVLAEAPAGGYDLDGQAIGYDYYRAGGLRVASLTGFPTFVGQHQYEQRPGDQVGPRFDQAKEFFVTTDIARARQLMADLRVGYVYVGVLERILFSEDSLRKFDVMADLGDLEIVYRNPDVTIYRDMRQGG
jgi:uncharacterized membrane protein